MYLRPRPRDLRILADGLRPTTSDRRLVPTGGGHDDSPHHPLASPSACDVGLHALAYGRAQPKESNMSHARYIGRVGGLAVALGVGLAVATTPGVAWADDTGSASSGGTTGTAGTTRTSGPSESEGTGPTTGTTTEPRAHLPPRALRRRAPPRRGRVRWTPPRRAPRRRRPHRCGGAAGDGECHRRRALVGEVEQRHLSCGR